MDFVSDILTPLGTKMGDSLNNLARTIIKGGCTFYNRLVNLASDFFTQSPAEFAGGEGADAWNLIMNCNTVFVSIAGTLLIVFWLIGYMSEITDIRQEVRMEQQIKMYIKLLFAEFLVCNALSIVSWIFSIGANVCGKLLGTGMNLGVDYAADIRPSLEMLNSEINSYVQGLTSLGNNIGLLILAIIFGMLIIAIGVTIFLASIKRFLKILVLIPYATLAGATVAGNHTIQRTAESFYRYAIAASFEVVTMLLMLGIGTALLKGNMLQDLAGTAPAASDGAGTILVYILQMLGAKAVLLGCVATGIKQSEQITQRIVG